MKLDEFDARVGAAISFLVVAGLGAGVSVSILFAYVYLGLHLNAWGLWSTGQGGFYEVFGNLVFGILIALSLYIAYRCAKKVYLYLA
jgi:hypothetical protein